MMFAKYLNFDDYFCIYVNQQFRRCGTTLPLQKITHGSWCKDLYSFKVYADIYLTDVLLIYAYGGTLLTHKIYLMYFFLRGYP